MLSEQLLEQCLEIDGRLLRHALESDAPANASNYGP